MPQDSEVGCADTARALLDAVAGEGVEPGALGGQLTWAAETFGTRQLAECFAELVEASPAQYENVLRNLVGAQVDLALAINKTAPLILAAAICGGVFEYAEYYGLMSLIGHAARAINADDDPVGRMLEQIRADGRGEFVAQVSERRLRTVRDLAGLGWVASDGAFVFDPAAAMPDEMELPSADACKGAEALDVDLDARRVQLLPIPSGRDRRIERFVSSIVTPEQFQSAAAVVSGARANLALLFAHRWAEYAARMSAPGLLSAAAVAACLPAVSEGTYDPAVRTIAVVLHVARSLQGGDAAVGVAVALLDERRRSRVAKVAASSDLLQFAGLREEMGPDGMTFRAGPTSPR